MSKDELAKLIKEYTAIYEFAPETYHVKWFMDDFANFLIRKRPKTKRKP